MELSALDTKAPAEAGAFCHLRAIPERGGHLLYTGPGSDETGNAVDKRKKPTAVGVYLRGFESDTVQKARKKAQRDAIKAGHDADDEETSLQIAAALIIDFQGITVDGEPLEPTHDNKMRFLKASNDLVEQILLFAKDRSHFFEKANSD